MYIKNYYRTTLYIMSSIMLSSNANSAMIQTVSASDSLKNPNIYSTETVFPAHALTWVKCEASSGTIGDGSQLNFQLQKYGIISQMLLTYTKKFTPTIGAIRNNLPAGDVFKTIRQIELLASSKTVSILTAEDLMAQFSDCSQSEFNVVSDTALKARAGVTYPAATGGDPQLPATAAMTEQKYVIPLCFPQFEMINCQLDSSFLEPLQVRITWNTIKSSSGGGAVYTTAGLEDCSLKMRYKNYSEQDTAAMISANYSAPQLNQLSARFYDEATVPYTQGATAGLATVAVDLKNTECVESFYVIVRQVMSTGTANGNARPCKPIKELKFTGSGQEICVLDDFDLKFARLGMDGWSEQVDTGTTASEVQLSNIGKVQLGLNTKQKATNSLSLREVNAPRITVSFDAIADAQYEVVVVQKVLAVFATSSATGRYSLALAN